jgi:hypothetical protein
VLLVPAWVRGNWSASSCCFYAISEAFVTFETFATDGGSMRTDSWMVWTSTAGRRPSRNQYSPLITKNEPRMVPASFDFCLANLNREASSAGTSIPSESLNPTARLPASSIV